MSFGYCNGYGSNDQYRCGSYIYDNTTYWNHEDTVATAAVTPLTPQSGMLLNCQNGEFVQPMMAVTNAQSSYNNIRQNPMINAQKSNVDEYSGGIKLLDISSKPQPLNPVPLETIQLSTEDGALNISSDDFGRYLEGINVAKTFTSDNSAEISSASRTDMEEEEECLTDSDSPKRTETRGRPRIFTDEENIERRQICAKESYHRCAERDVAYRQSLFEEVKKLQREKNKLLQEFGRLMNHSENLANFMQEDDKNYARNYIQIVKANVEKVKKSSK